MCVASRSRSFIVKLRHNSIKNYISYPRGIFNYKLHFKLFKGNIEIRNVFNRSEQARRFYFHTSVDLSVDSFLFNLTINSISLLIIPAIMILHWNYRSKWSTILTIVDKNTYIRERPVINVLNWNCESLISFLQ